MDTITRLIAGNLAFYALLSAIIIALLIRKKQLSRIGRQEEITNKPNHTTT